MIGMMKRWKKICLGVFLLLFTALISFGALLYFSPDTTSYLTQRAFANGDAYPLHPQQEEKIKYIQIEHDLSYSSSSLATYDLYYPKDNTVTYPVILWLHGGAYVGGDKQDCAGFLTMLASEGYVVVNMNYPLAPEDTYPAPLLAINELSLQLQTTASAYPMNLNQLFIGGDSAGANLAGSFVNIQMNPAYAKQLQMAPVWSRDKIKGYLSFCGLLDLYGYDETDSWFSNFLYKQSAASYFDDRHWKTSDTLQQLNFIDAIEAFPPAYVTDGAKDSFQKQAEAFVAVLQERRIAVTSLFFEKPLGHEYQFQLNTEEALKNYEQVLSFLKEAVQH